MNEATTDPGRISLKLELEPGVEPISGRLVAVDGRSVDFVGWLGLSSALERLARMATDGSASGRPAAP